MVFDKCRCSTVSVSLAQPLSYFHLHLCFVAFLGNVWLQFVVSIIQPVLFAHLSHSFQFVLLFLFVLF